MVILISIVLYSVYNYYKISYKPNFDIDNAEKVQQEIITQIKPDVITALESGKNIAEILETQSAGSFENHTDIDNPLVYEISVNEISVEENSINENSVNENSVETIENPIRDSSPKYLEKARTTNNECVAWVYIPDTNINFPITQHDDNSFYLDNGIDQKYDFGLGCPFLDCRCEPDFSGFNSIVYGHYMTKQRMFAHVEKFSDESFLDEHKIGYLLVDNQLHEVEFFTYLSVSSTSTAYHTAFFTPNDKSDYINYILMMSNYSKYSADDLNNIQNLHLLMLSTCTFEYEESRGILVGIIK